MDAVTWDIERVTKILRNDPAHKMVTPTPQEMKHWGDALQPYINQWIAKAPNRASLLDSYKAELELIRAGN